MKQIKLDSKYNIKIAVNHFDSHKKRPVIIICPGCFMTKDAKPFKSMSEDLYENFDVIAMDFRGHGKSNGLFTFTAREFEDLKTVVDYAKEKYSRIGILAFSLGAATAIIYASIYKNIDSIITVSAPADFHKIENHFLKKEMLLSAFEKFEWGKNPNIRPGNLFAKKIKPVNVIDKINHIPILFITGDNDRIIYSWHSEELYRKALCPKKILKFKDGLHSEDIYRKMKKEFLSDCNSWFKKTL